jgi:RND family efflux transporter MFP subunit
MKALFEADVASQQQLDVAKKNFEVAEARLRTALKSLEDDAVLRAPFSGIVARKLVEDFQNVQAKQTVLVLQDDSTLELRVDVPEADFGRMPPDLSNQERTDRTKPEVSVSSIPDRSFPARIQEFSTTADPTTRTYQATFAFENPGDVTILPGMTAKVTVRLSAPEGGGGAFAIPAQAALADEQGDAFVWVVDPAAMTVHRRPVTLGEMSGSTVAVQSGLASGDQIAISGVHQLREGMVVRRYQQ